MNDQPESATEEEPPEGDSAVVRRGIPALSVQATAIIRAIDALGAISWWSLGGMALTLLFTGLIRLQRDLTLESVFIGEYQVPTEFLPQFGVAFGIFIQWMLATRVLHVCRVFESSTLPVQVMRDMVRLNPPMINLFEPNGTGRLMSGLGVFVAVWAVFYGNLVGLMWFLFVARVTSVGVSDSGGLLIFGGMLVLNGYFAWRHLRPALVRLHRLLFSEKVRFGVRRSVMGAALFLITGAYQVEPLLTDITEQDNGLLGPVVANAVDGDTLFVNGWQVDLFGIDAVESSQSCLLPGGGSFRCGHEATAHLQALVQDTQVLCWPLVSTAERTVTAFCVLDAGQALPTEGGGVFLDQAQQPYNLSRRMVRDGYAVPMGVGPQVLGSELAEAQGQRRGIWRASVEPPWMYRRDGGD